MAVILRIVTSDSTDAIIDLAHVKYSGIVQYAPKPPESGAESVTETCQINFRYGDGSDPYVDPDGAQYTPRGKIAAISRMFALARARQINKTGTRVFIEFEPTTGTAYRSEVYDGVAPAPDEEYLGWELAANELICTIAWTRAPWWEGAETQLHLTNGSATATLSPLVVNNQDGASSDNWFNIPATELPRQTAGDLESPVKLEITNTTLAATTTAKAWKFFVGMSKSNNFASNRIPVLEGESGTVGAGVTGTNFSVADASGGSYKSCAWTGTSTVTLLSWTISGADLTRMGGMRYIPIIRFEQGISASDIDLKWEVHLSSTRISPPSGWVRALTTENVLVMNGGEIPPYLAGTSNYAALTFKLFARRVAGGSSSLPLDAVYLMPADKVHGGFRTYTPLAYGVEKDTKLVDNGIDELLYVDETAIAGGIWGHYRADGEPLVIRPNCNNQFYILHTGDTGDQYANRTLTVKAYYRPRRSTV